MSRENRRFSWCRTLRGWRPSVPLMPSPPPEPHLWTHSHGVLLVLLWAGGPRLVRSRRAVCAITSHAARAAPQTCGDSRRLIPIEQLTQERLASMAAVPVVLLIVLIPAMRTGGAALVRGLARVEGLSRRALDDLVEFPTV
jgi:hypothetical protein